MVNLFRTLVLSSFTLYLVFFFIPFLDPYLYDTETLNVITWEGYGRIFDIPHAINYIFILAYLVTLIGVLYFQSWARISFLILTVLSIIVTGIQGMQILPPIEGVLMYFINLVDGATIILMYFSSLSTRFNKYA